MEKFRKLGLIKPIVKIIKKEGFEKPTEIQEKTIPLVLDGKDVIAESATGSGKTLAFITGILQNLPPQKGIKALILSPTRELASQIADEIKRFSKHKKLRVSLIHGGVSINPQIKALKTADVVVATPGRLLDHLSRGTIKLNRVNTVVLDEADRMSDMGFIDDIKRILSYCPKKRQTLLYSATISGDVMYIAKHYMHSPKEVSAKSRVDPKKLKQVFYDVMKKPKVPLLAHLLDKETSKLVMIFCNTRKCVDYVTRKLKHRGFDATAIHGGFSQNKRTKTMKKFNSNNVNVLVCTDVAARGLDVQGVSHVYNYDVPNHSKKYIHRIGRTARAGKDGIAITILGDRDYENFTRLRREQHVEPEERPMPKYSRIKKKNNHRRNSKRNNSKRHKKKHYKSRRHKKKYHKSKRRRH